MTKQVSYRGEIVDMQKLKLENMLALKERMRNVPVSENAIKRREFINEKDPSKVRTSSVNTNIKEQESEAPVQTSKSKKAQND